MTELRCLRSCFKTLESGVLAGSRLPSSYGICYVYVTQSEAASWHFASLLLHNDLAHGTYLFDPMPQCRIAILKTGYARASSK